MIMDTSIGQTRSLGTPVAQRSRAPLALAAVPAARLALPAGDVPDSWQQSLEGLLNWLHINLAQAPSPAARRFSHLTEWASAGGSVSQAAVFAPWQTSTTTSLFQPGAGGAGQATWIASYLFDYGAARLPRRSPLDVMVMSPLPWACEEAQAGHGPLPALRLITTMIAAAKAQGRSKLAIIVDAASRNTITSQLLMAERALTREEIAITIVPVEEALRTLVRQCEAWDALIVMPQWRSVTVALLAELSGITGPWPLLWHRRGLQRVTSEAAVPNPRATDCDAPLLVLSLVAALQEQGQGFAARKLFEAAAQLWERGVATPGRPSDAPYAHQLSDAEFLQHITLAAPAAASTRLPEQWHMLTETGNTPRPRSVPDLRLVGPA
jgi:hypothetical protein